MAYNAANLGRGGDNKIRNVEGETSHVNPYEAYLIDTYGGAGEDAVMEMGSGTINPATGMREYQTGAVAAAATQAAPSFLSKAGSFLASPGFGAVMWGVDLLAGWMGKGKAKAAAGRARTASLAQLVQEQKMIEEQTALQGESIVKTFEADIRDLTSQTVNKSSEVKGMDKANLKSNMALVEQNVYDQEVANKRVHDENWNINRKIIDTRSINERQLALTAERDRNQAKDRHENRLTQIDSMV